MQEPGWKGAHMVSIYFKETMTLLQLSLCQSSQACPKEGKASTSASMSNLRNLYISFVACTSTCTSAETCYHLENQSEIKLHRKRIFFLKKKGKKGLFLNYFSCITLSHLESSEFNILGFFLGFFIYKKSASGWFVSLFFSLFKG